MVYVYKKDKQINKWNERILKYKKEKFEHCGDLSPKNTMIAMIKSHLRSNHWANWEVEKYRLYVIDE